MKEKHLDGLSFDNVHERIETLKRMFPEAVKEGRLDYDTFMALFGDEFDNDREKYDFTWKGKLDSLKLAQRRSNGTLRPAPEESRDWDTTGNLYPEGDNLETMNVCYARSDQTKVRGKSIDKGKYSNPDNDPRGDWMSDNMVGLATKDQRPNLHYDLAHPVTGIVYACPPTGWRYEKKRMQQLVENEEVLFPKTEDGRPRRKKFLAELNSEFTGVSTLLETAFNTQGTREVRDIFDGMDFFDFPKPVDLVKIAVEQGANEPESIVLDFFAGSSTTAQAVMQANAEDGLNRKFICIQLPEPLLRDGEAHTAGYRTIADIGKERIRRAGDKILAAWNEQHADRLSLGGDAAQPTPPDIGFRVFRLDRSNWKPWDDTFVPPAERDLFVERMKASLDPVKPGRSDLDMVYEVMLKYVVPLTEPVTPLTVAGETFYSVRRRGTMLVRLDKDITVETVEAVLAQHTPGVILFADACFDNNSDLTNAALVLEKADIEFRWV